MNYRFRTITYPSMLSNFAASRTRCGLLVSLPFLHTFLCALSCLLSSCLLLPCLPTLHLSSCCLLLGNILSYLLACLASSCLVFFWLHLSSFVLNLGDWFFLEWTSHHRCFFLCCLIFSVSVLRCLDLSCLLLSWLCLSCFLLSRLVLLFCLVMSYLILSINFVHGGNDFRMSVPVRPLKVSRQRVAPTPPCCWSQLWMLCGASS